MVGIRVTAFEGEGAIELSSGDYAATFVPAVGMLGVSLRFRDQEFLALPGSVAEYRAGTWTGLPILHPWANRLGATRFSVAGKDVDLTGLPLPMDPPGVPIHGTLTGDPGWRLGDVSAPEVDVVNDTATLEADFDHTHRSDLLAAFPFPHTLRVQIELSRRGLRVVTVLETSEPTPASFGWHPYLRLPSGPRSTWRLGLPERAHLELDDRGLPTGRSTDEHAELAALDDRVFDDLYALADERRLSIEDDASRLVVEFEDGYPYAQVYAPPDRDFVCLEPMTAATNALVDGTAPIVGEFFSAAFSIRVEASPVDQRPRATR